jgi:hypothetical protein
LTLSDIQEDGLKLLRLNAVLLDKAKKTVIAHRQVNAKVIIPLNM